MSFTVRAITLDLDDTLWPFAPIGERIERVLDAWMREHSPATAIRFPTAEMRALRDRVCAENPHLVHDLGALRRLTLQRALAESDGDVALADAAYEAFYEARNQVECYPDAIDALQRIAARVPVAALTNGNADLERIGLAAHFRFNLGAREHGAAKPEASIFHAACTRLGCAPGEVLHVGDHIEMDVLGAVRAGLRSCWINREGLDWPYDDARPDPGSEPAPYSIRGPGQVLRPDLEFDTLAALADWLDAASRTDHEAATA